MRLHTNIPEDRFRGLAASAAEAAGVGLELIKAYGSQSRAYAYTLEISGKGMTGGRYGNLGYRTAVWDEWGMVLGHIYDIDPAMVATGSYESARHFHWATGGRFHTLTPADVCLRHKWQAEGWIIKGLQTAHTCKRCEAYTRTLQGPYVPGSRPVTPVFSESFPDDSYEDETIQECDYRVAQQGRLEREGLVRKRGQQRAAGIVVYDGYAETLAAIDELLAQEAQGDLDPIDVLVRDSLLAGVANDRANGAE